VGFCCKSFAATLCLLLLAGCPRHIPAVALPKQEVEIALKLLAKENARRHQVQGTLQARFSGLKQFLGSVEIDIIAQAPSRIYVAQRSFFSQPSKLFASDGETSTLLDLADVNKPLYLRSSARSGSIEGMLPIAVSPSDMTGLLLGQAPIVDAQITDALTDGSQFQLSLLQPDGRKAVIWIRPSDGLMVASAMFDTRGDMIYHVDYEDMRDEKGVMFAHRWIVRARHGVDEIKLILQAKEIEINGPLFPKEAFSLPAP